MSAHTCDECGVEGFLHRHHERHGPNVIVYLCPPCHMALHAVRGLPGKPLFEATRGLTLAEAAAVRAVAALRRQSPIDLVRVKSIAEVVASFARIRAVMEVA